MSTDFLYRSPELRTQIERHRAKGGSASGGATQNRRPTLHLSRRRALSARLTRQQQAHHAEVTRLRKTLEVAQGENLDLRRRLARYEAD